MRETPQRYDAEHRHATAYLLARRKATGCNESVIVLTNTRVVVERACSASVSRAAKVLADILDPAAEQTIRFHDLVSLLRRLGFSERTRGSHHVLVREDVAEILNLQPRRDGSAKPYQVRQVRHLILRYRLHLGLSREEREDD